jgi:adhesin HecA-like repeat protein
MGGGGGFMNFLGGIAKAGMSYFGDPNSLGFSGMNAPSYATAGELDNNGGFGPGTGSMRANALGGVYDQGRVAFAKGGTFSNTIVSRPTTFAFAKGAGLMGESGPEAIMPLKRGPNGSLGVQGGGGSNVDVVVNNYGTEKATTKETTDARGNRRIEVIIGEMTAAEMTRPNSPVQTSMRSTFGLAPSLTRR